MARLNELIAEIHESGASLTVEKGKLGIRGKVPDRLRASIRENQQALTKYLTYDQETVYELLRAARAYIAERYLTAAKLELENETLDQQTAQAEINEDMWALRIAVREWVLAWVQAIAQARNTTA